MKNETIEVVYVTNNPYPYKLIKPITTLSGHVVNAICMVKNNQVGVNIQQHEIVSRKSIPLEPWM
jgi:hypothetical protein